MSKLFGKINMTWAKTICFAIIAGVYTGAIMLVPALKGTSFQDIGVSYEWWVIFAVIIVVNCKKSTEAMVKCFIFFLISQPLVYAVEIVFGSLTFDQAWMYYRYWFVLTILTLPGGFIAYYCKKQNLIGSIILGLGNSIQALMALYYASAAVKHFPYHLLSAIVSVLSVFVMSYHIQKKKFFCWLSILLPVAVMILLYFVTKMTGRVLF